jgi:hypothetical protein
MAHPLRIAIADDHVLFRQGLRAMLKCEEGVTIVAEVNRASELPVLSTPSPTSSCSTSRWSGARSRTSRRSPRA